MPTQEERNEVAIEVSRVKWYLETNRLVQAHGIAQKIANMVAKVAKKESKDGKVEDHEWWKPMKKASRLIVQIRDGNPDGDGLGMLSDLGESI